MNTATGVVTTTVSDSTGNYGVPFLPPSTYSISVEVAGFAKAVNSSIVLHAQEPLRLDFALQIGNTKQEISVVAQAPMLKTSDSATGQGVSSSSIAELPILNRNIASLALLGPGMGPVNNNFTNVARILSTALQGAVSITANGLRDLDNEYTIDGANVNVGMYNYPGIVPVPDGVEEVQVLTGSYGAESGQYMGTHVNYVLKSGTNAFHGNVWEFLENNKLDARNFFSPTVPPLHQNQFGGMLGGPIKKNKTFFMASYEGSRLSTSTYDQDIVPTAAERNGNLAYDPSGKAYAPFINPATGGPFAGNQIPSGQITSQASAILNLLAPQPNLAWTGAANWGGFVPLPTSHDDALVKVDHSFSERDQFSARYAIFDLTVWAQSQSAFLPPGAVFNNPVKGQNVALIETHTFSPNVVLASRVSWNRLYDWSNFTQNPSGLNPVQLLGIANPSGAVAGDIMCQYPEFLITGFGDLGQNPSGKLFQPDSNYVIASDLEFLKARHTVKTGFQVGREGAARLSNPTENGELQFEPTNPAGTGNALADLLLGLPTQSTIGLQPLTVDLRRTFSAFYIDDKWLATKKFTLDLGLRYELDPPLNEHWGRVPLFDFTSPGSIELLRPGQALYDTDFRDFAPRVGAAYRLSDNNVIRAGWGMYYNLFDLLQWTTTATNPPFVYSYNLYAAVGNPLLISNPYPLSQAASAVPSPNSFQPNPHTPEAQEWMFDFQHSFSKDMMLDVAYVGNHAYHMIRRMTLNYPLQPGPGAIQSRRPLPNWGPISYLDFDSPSKYNGLQVKFEKRFSKGLSLLASYTWSKTLDIVSSDANTNTIDPSHLNRDYGRGSFDLPQIFTIGYNYQLPVGRGRRYLASGGLRDEVLGGWEVSGVTTEESGIPFTVAYPGDVANVGLTTRPNRVCNGGLGSSATIHEWFNTSCFVAPAQYSYGNSGRDILSGPDFRNWNIGVDKKFHTYENQYLQFRAEFYNAFNNVQFGLPSATVTAAGAGGITSLASPTTTGRIVEFGLQYYF
jgi:hypothetical protein